MDLETNGLHRLLHFLTALFHEVKDRKHEHREAEKAAQNGHDGYANGERNGNGFA